MTKAVIGKSKVDDEVLDDLEEISIASDVGLLQLLKSSKELKNELQG
jgi:fused signal recognition particle receptor